MRQQNLFLTLFLSLFLFAPLLHAQQKQTPYYYKGDVDGDGDVDVADVVVTTRMVLRQTFEAAPRDTIRDTVLQVQTHIIRDTIVIERTIIQRDTVVLNIQASGNVLSGKKWWACGDSYTAWSDSIYPSGPFAGCNITYPYIIGSRNGMQVYNEAVSGSTLVNLGTRTDYFANTRYKEAPFQPDYITLMFGLNEVNAKLGTKTSTDVKTVWGAYNQVMRYLIVTYPLAKIGIIISDSWMTNELADTLIDIARYWGVPYLDLKRDPKITKMLGTDGVVKQEAASIRHNALVSPKDDDHCGVVGHEYRSTIIEHWLRSL